MPFQPGDHVHVAGLGKGIIRAARNRGRLLVEIKGRSMLVDERQLRAVDPPRPGQLRPSRPNDVPEGLARSHAAAAIDLHGLTADEAEAALEAFISDAILAGHDAVRVIHGRGGGRLKTAVHRRLAKLHSIRGFHLDRENSGVTIVQL